MDWTTNTIRTIVWWLTKYGISLMDKAYEILTTLLGLSLDKYPFIWSWLKGLFFFLAFLIMCRLFVLAFKILLDEKVLDRFSPQDILKKLIVMLLIYALVPVILPNVSRAANELTQKLPVVFGIEDERPSTVITSAICIEATGDETELTFSNFEELQTTIDAEKNGINQTIKVNSVESYKYFSDTMTLVTCLLISVSSCFLILFISIQVAQRLLNILLSVIVIPVVASQMIDPDSQALSNWYKLLASELLTNIFQMILFWLAIVATISISDIGSIARSILYIGMLLGVLEGPTMIANLFGSQIGLQKSMQSVATISRGANLMKSTVTATAGAYYTLANTVTGNNFVGSTAGKVISAVGGVVTNTVGSTALGQAATQKFNDFKNGTASGQLYNKVTTRVSTAKDMVGGVGKFLYGASAAITGRENLIENSKVRSQYQQQYQNQFNQYRSTNTMNNNSRDGSSLRQ